ncbi:DgyrCDS7867 [Dimorphilus gyrociliatus]|uniref:NADH dehydrogenase [ubiquinone] 1 beta subcomplex subunit 9 n=1 Tax=Dimorphilus gyrociliatus TaxID=2664684 RepID=A0A7I8VXA4_9ANNE|nr:DgyrCDS7867 [Dimorphilus gyrociliatus]
MAYLQTKAISQAARVRRLYKESLRNLQAYYIERHLYRYHAVLLRQRFDENKDINDVRKAKEVLQAGEHELFLKAHPQPIKYPDSPGGVAYGREPWVPDWLIDHWHPSERKQYPDYFAKREKAKLEYIDRWNKKYGVTETPDTKTSA